MEIERRKDREQLEFHAVPCSRRSLSCRQRREMDVVLAPIMAALQVPGFNKVHRGKGEIDLTGNWKVQCVSPLPEFRVLESH